VSSEREIDDERGTRTRIIVERIHLDAPHGVYPEEREVGNRFRVDIEIVADLAAALASDSLDDTVDYDSVVRLVEQVSRQRRFNLIESFAGAISDTLLERFPRIDETVVRVAKLSPPGSEHVACAVAEVSKARQ
jgi:dihydroneopterin aldolase